VRLEAEQGGRMVALDYLAVAIRNHHESGNFGMVHNPLAMLASVLDRLGRHESAATMAGFAVVSPLPGSRHTTLLRCSLPRSIGIQPDMGRGPQHGR
jgi:hypothetical protein